MDKSGSNSPEWDPYAITLASSPGTVSSKQTTPGPPQTSYFQDAHYSPFQTVPPNEGRYSPQVYHPYTSNNQVFGQLPPHPETNPLSDPHNMSSRYPTFLKDYKPLTSTTTNTSATIVPSSGLGVSEENEGALPNNAAEQKRNLLRRFKFSVTRRLRAGGEELRHKERESKEEEKRNKRKEEFWKAKEISRPTVTDEMRRTIWAGRGDLVMLGEFGAGIVNVPEEEGSMESHYVELRRVMREMKRKDLAGNQEMERTRVELSTGMEHEKEEQPIFEDSPSNYSQDEEEENPRSAVSPLTIKRSRDDPGGRRITRIEDFMK
jgi:hypothetical protein